MGYDDKGSTQTDLVPAKESKPSSSATDGHATELEPSDEAGVSLSASHSSRWGQISLRAAGLYAGAGVAGAGFMGILLWGHPQTDAQQFILSSLLAFVTGAFTNAVMSAGRVADALREKENYRREAQRVARAKTALEEKYFAWRLSSGSTDDRKKGGR